MSASRTKEFGLSDGIPEAVLETELRRAKDAWRARSDAAADEVAVPAAPYRIRGDAAAGAWFVEAAEVVRSSEPRGHYGYDVMLIRLYTYSLPGGERRLPQDYYTSQIEAYEDDCPTATLEWATVGKKSRGFFTYARAAKWLREYLEPIRDESTYFRPDGHPT